MSRKWLWIYGGMVLFILGTMLYLYYSDKQVTSTTVMYHQEIPKNTIYYQSREIIPTATLLAVGDVLIHDSVYNAAKTGQGYDFRPMFQMVKPYISKADIAIANSESIIGGRSLGLSNYPSFNSPFEVGDALKDTGFDVVTMANNHTLDRGPQAINNAIHYWDKIGMLHTGSFLNSKAHDQIVTIKKNGITFSFLAYTYGTNGIPTPARKSYLVNRIDLPLMKKDIERARAQSDVVVVSLHFGTEYERYPNNNQKNLVKSLADLGVDIVLGSHPHVLQPYTFVPGKDGHQTFVIYSLGNFISGQIGTYKQIGGCLELTVKKTMNNGKSKVVIEKTTFIPTWVQPKTFDIIPLKQAGNYGLPQARLLNHETMLHMEEK